MSNKNLRTVIILGIASILSILTIQFFWIKKNIQFQETNIAIQNKQDSLSQVQFGDQVTIALKKVADEIQRINQQPGDLYGNVKQLTSNYFTVELQDTLHPFLLELLLKHQFYQLPLKKNEQNRNQIPLVFVNQISFLLEDFLKKFHQHLFLK